MSHKVEIIAVVRFADPPDCKKTDHLTATDRQDHRRWL